MVSLAGPKVLEHCIDCSVLLTATPIPASVHCVAKNRFGAVNELGVFAMTEQGCGSQQPFCYFLKPWR
jgi:DNA repair protein RadA/Sms